MRWRRRTPGGITSSRTTSCFNHFKQRQKSSLLLNCYKYSVAIVVVSHAASSDYLVNRTLCTTRSEEISLFPRSFASTSAWRTCPCGKVAVTREVTAIMIDLLEPVADMSQHHRDNVTSEEEGLRKAFKRNHLCTTKSYNSSSHNRRTTGTRTSP